MMVLRTEGEHFDKIFVQFKAAEEAEADICVFWEIGQGETVAKGLKKGFKLKILK